MKFAAAIRWSGTLGTVMALAGLVASSLPAAAQTGCNDYARLALEQARENEQRKCGFEGPEWNTDRKRHLDWCGTVGPAQWKASLQKRAQMLSTQCRK